MVLGPEVVTLGPADRSDRNGQRAGRVFERQGEVSGEGPCRWPPRRPGDPHDRGPLFVGETYLVRREIAALSESKRTESYWIRTRIFDAAGKKQMAEMLLNHAVLKGSYSGYEAQAQG